MKKIFAIVLAILMLAGCCASLASCGGNKDTIKIGLSGPLTGAAAVYGQGVQNAAQMAVDEINAAGGLNGVLFELKALDDKNDKNNIANNYAALVDWGMQISLGCVTTQPALEFKSLSKEDNIFFMTPSASADAVRSESNGYQMCFADQKQGVAAANYVNGLGLSKIGVFYQTDIDYAAGIYQVFNSRIGLNAQEGNLQLSGIVGCSWSGYHPFNIGKRLKLLAGAQIQLEGGALYNMSNGNNPVSAKLRTALAASGMAIYHFPVLKNDWIVRYQLDIPLIGAMFTPEFGQSYYEISLGHLGKIASFTHPINNPSWRHMLSLDIPLHIKHHSTTLRLSYIADLYQSDINYIRCHMYHHAVTFGFARTIFKVKRENSIKAYSPY